MSFIFQSTKPSISIGSPLCTFRTSKAYLWGLVRKLLHEKQEVSQSPLHILDAACHSLITRSMFPAGCFYYGLDISKSRLEVASSRRLSEDILFIADLTKDLKLRSCFNVVVSLNTMSHLLEPYQSKAVNNLLMTLRASGSLFLNSSVSDSFHLARLLQPLFTSVTPVYFDSYVSAEMEKNSLVNAGNVSSLLIANELNIPNDACLHQQVLFICEQYLPSSPKPASLLDKLRRQNNLSSKLVSLNILPNLSRINLKTDSDLFNSSFNDRQVIFLFTPYLASSPYGHSLISKLQLLGFSTHELTLDFIVEHDCSAIYILGLENEWCDDLNSARIAINNIRSKTSSSINLVFVSNRQSTSCTPSVVLCDY